MNSYPNKMRVAEIQECLGGAPDLFLEIGCNDGEDTLQFVSAWPTCHVVAFEPDPRPIEKFKARMKNAGIGRDRCELVEAAISDEIGETELFMSAGAEGFHDPEWDKSSSICQPTRHLIRSPEITFPNDTLHRRSVVTLTLDSWWGCFLEDHPEHVFIDFIWCDPQGAQAKILRGGNEALHHTKWLYIEYYPSPLYKDEPTLDDMIEMLPDWDLVATYEHENALFRNMAFN